MKVTVCDDSLMSRKSVIKSLPLDWASEITQCKHGLEALEACRSGLTDVLFLDLTMPIMDGLEVLERLNSENIKIPVIIISADFQPQVQQRAQALGALAFLPKPINADRLATTLKQASLL